MAKHYIVHCDGADCTKHTQTLDSDSDWEAIRSAAPGWICVRELMVSKKEKSYEEIENKFFCGVDCLVKAINSI